MNLLLHKVARVCNNKIIKHKYNIIAANCKEMKLSDRSTLENGIQQQYIKMEQNNTKKLNGDVKKLTVSPCNFAISSVALFLKKK